MKLHSITSPAPAGKHAEFKQLYKKYVNGTRWLNQQAGQGVCIDKDKAEFEEQVVKPMAVIWETFTDNEKDALRKVDMVVKKFNGRIL